MISFINHPSKVMLKIILNGLKPQTEKIITEKQAGLRAGRSTTVAPKRPKSICQKCRWQVTPKHTHTFDPMKSEWADYATVQA